MNAILYIHGKGGSATESEHWFHTEKQMVFLDNWIKESIVRQLPTCSQCIRSLLWNTGTPGKYWKVLFTR